MYKDGKTLAPGVVAWCKDTSLSYRQWSQWKIKKSHIFGPKSKQKGQQTISTWIHPIKIRVMPLHQTPADPEIRVMTRNGPMNNSSWNSEWQANRTFRYHQISLNVAAINPCWPLNLRSFPTKSQNIVVKEELVLKTEIIMSFTAWDSQCIVQQFEPMSWQATVWDPTNQWMDYPCMCVGNFEVKLLVLGNKKGIF